MPKTIVNFTLPFTLVDKGEYNVSLGRKTAKIIIAIRQNRANLKNYGYEVTSTGSGGVELVPDPHGIANISDVTIELPFINERPNDLVHRLPQKVVIENKIPAKELDVLATRRDCILYLNRLIAVVRYATNMFWITPISQRDIISIAFRAYDDNGQIIEQGEAGGGFSGIKTSFFKQAEVKQDIGKILSEELRIPFYEVLTRDVLYYFSTMRYNESVILANVAMENLAIEHLYQRLIEKEKSELNARKEIAKVKKERHFSTIMTEHFKKIDGRSLKDNKELYLQFEYARCIRKIAVHPHSRDVKENEASRALNNFFAVMQWISEPDALPRESAN